MLSRVLLTAALVVISLGQAGAEPGSPWLRGSDVCFEVSAKDLGLQISNPYLEGKGPEDKVRVGLRGKKLGKPVPINAVDQKGAGYSTVERALASISSANAAGNVPWIARGFVPEERGMVEEFFADSELLAQNTRLNSTVQKRMLLGQTVGRGFRVALVGNTLEGGRVLRQPVVLKRTEEGWKMTNFLRGDFTFDVIFSALRSGSFGPCPK